jgi:hypothetical protein
MVMAICLTGRRGTSRPSFLSFETADDATRKSCGPPAASIAAPLAPRNPFERPPHRNDAPDQPRTLR